MEARIQFDGFSPLEGAACLGFRLVMATIAEEAVDRTDIAPVYLLLAAIR